MEPGACLQAGVVLKEGCEVLSELAGGVEEGEAVEACEEEGG